MDILTQEHVVQGWKAMRTPEDPLVATEPEVISLEDDVLPWVADKVREGNAPEISADEEKITLDFHTDAGVVRNRMNIYPNDEGEMAVVRDALDGVITRRKR